MRNVVIALGAAAAALYADAAGAQEQPLQFGRYMPLYPGLYLNAGFVQDDRDWTFTQQGRDVNTVAPQTPGKSAFPEKTGFASFTWHFPMFETYRVPFFSSRTHLARATLHLRAGPDLAAVISHMDGTAQRLHRGVRQEGCMVDGLDHLDRLPDCQQRLAILPRYRAGFP